MTANRPSNQPIPASSPAEQVLAHAQAGREVVQDFVPLADSLEWDLGQQYLRLRGNKAFLSDASPVPFVVNNDGSLSRNAAEVFFGGTSSFAYDGDANATKTVNADGFTTTRGYDGDDRLTKTVNPDNFTATVSFDSAGRTTKSVDGAGNTVTTQYDADSNVTSTIDGAGNTTSNQYDPAGLVTVSVNGRGYTTSSYYDPDLRLTKSVDPDLYSTLQSYDPAGQVTKTVDANGHTVLTSFDSAGLATNVVDGDSYTSTTAFDADNRATKVVDGDGHTSLAAYDPNGNVTLATDGAGVTTQTAFDKDANVTKTVAHGYTSTAQFDPDNNKTASVDGNGKTTTNAFDPADQLTKVTDPDANGTTYTLDGAGNATLITNPNGYTTQQKFDGDGRITQRITPDGGTVNFTYDGDGRVTGDGNGTRSYNADGLVATASNIYGTYAFSYDPDDRLTNVTEPFSQSLSYAYDPVGNQTQVTDSQSGTTVSTYDSDNYLTARTYTGQLQNLRVNFTNNKEGWNTTLARYSDLAGTTLVATSKYQYDGAGNVTNVLATGPTGTTINQFAYALDGNGNLTSETDTQSGTATTINYAYDSAGQVTSAGSNAYGYDSNGNRNTGSDTVTTGNEMSADANWTYKYDKEGELTEKDTTVGGSSEKWTYAWSANGNLTEAKHYNAAGSLALTVDYNYDAFGEMIQKSDGTVTSRYAKDGWISNMLPSTSGRGAGGEGPTGNENMNTWAVLNGSNQWQERDVWGNQVDQELGRIVLSANNYTLYPLQDRQQSVRDVVTAAGAVDDSIAYDAFGNITSETNIVYRGQYAYTGRQFDVETDLQYNHARWYDPATGRWQSQDPLGFDAGDSNLYRYVHNSPLVESDPSGLEWMNGRWVGAGPAPPGGPPLPFELKKGSSDKREFSLFKDLRAISDGFGSGGVLVRKDFPWKQPEIKGFTPGNPNGTTTIGQHALNEPGAVANSPYISASTNPKGSPKHTGTRYYIDIRRFEQAGGRVIRSNEILAELNGMDASYVNRVQMWRSAQRAGEGEVLLQGYVPANAVRGPTAMALTKGIKALGVYGKVMTVWDVGNAAKESIQKESINPLGKEVVRQAGSWGGAWAGAKAGAAVGFLLGIEGGPLAIVTGAVGAIGGGIAGFWVGDQLAEAIFSDTKHELRPAQQNLDMLGNPR